jgi:hypothetical protein
VASDNEGKGRVADNRVDLGANLAKGLYLAASADNVCLHEAIGQTNDHATKVVIVHRQTGGDDVGSKVGERRDEVPSAAAVFPDLCCSIGRRTDKLALSTKTLVGICSSTTISLRA